MVIKNAEEIVKDESLIPKGRYCYTPIGWVDGSYHTIPCPYKNRTNYGTVRCEYLGVESIDPTPYGKECYQKALKNFGSDEAVRKATSEGGLIWDGCKECDVD